MGRKHCGKRRNCSLEAQGLETCFNMHKYTKLLTFLTKIRISEYKHIQGIELHGGQFGVLVLGYGLMDSVYQIRQQ